MRFLNKLDTNRAVQAQKMAKAWKQTNYCAIRVAKTKALISFAVTAKLIYAFVFTNHMQNVRFSQDAAHIYS